MAAEFIVAGRVPLPAHSEPWEYVLQNDEGGLEIYESAVAYEDPARVAEEVGKVVGWQPQSVGMIRKAWELGRVVAEELASALQGAVFCDVDDDVFFDAKDQPKPVSSMAELESRLHHSFMHPEPFFARWDAQDKEDFVPDQEAEDWSGV
jgi:hypothetical protein